SVFALVAMAALPANCQVLYGSVVGAIEDPSGAAVPKALITLRNQETGATRETVADEAGRYSVLNLWPGKYDVKITAPGFRLLTRTDVEVTINTITRADARLEIGLATEQVTVTAVSVLLETDKSDLRHEIDGNTVQNLPL